MKKAKLTKIIAGSLIAVSVLALNPIGASAQWKKDNTGWWYTEGSSWVTGWRLIDGNWYYFNSNGYMRTGWVLDRGKWYYLDLDGKMAFNTTIVGYYLDSSGAWIENASLSSSNRSTGTITDKAQATNFVSVTSVALSKTSLNIEKGNKSKLTATVTPYNASNKEVKWVTSDSKVATVDNDGKITGVGDGTVTITCKTIDGSNKSATCIVTVTNPVNEEDPGTTYPTEDEEDSGTTYPTVNEEDPGTIYPTETETKTKTDNTTETKTDNTTDDELHFYFDKTKGEITRYGWFGCPVTTAVIPSTIDGVSVKRIGSDAFDELFKLKSVSIPNSVTYIGYEAFKDCESLTDINIPNSVIDIDELAFINCSSLTRINIPNGVTHIGKRAFEACSNLESIIIPNSVKTIPDGAFCRCSSLTSVIIPNSITSIEERAFSGCSSLKSISIPDGVTNIEIATFFNCSSLTSIVIPDSVKSIRDSAFEGCSSLASVTILATDIKELRGDVFKNCKNATFYVKNKEIKSAIISSSGIDESKIIINS